MLDRIARSAGGVVVLIGSTVLLGWALGHETLKSGMPGLVTMKANTALCFILTGLAAGMLAGRAARGVIRGLILAMLGIALASMIEYYSGRSLGIDELFFTDSVSPQIGLPPGRMALATALAFLCCGVAILLIDRGRHLLAQYLTFAALLIALFSLTAYLFGEGKITMFSPYTSLAVHTALGIFILGVGILCQCATAGPMAVVVADDSGGESLRRLLPLTVLATVCYGLISAGGMKFGLYAVETGMVLFATGATVILAVAVWHNSQSLSHSEVGRRADLERFRLTLQSIGDAVIATDGAGRVTFLNGVAEGLTGWTTAEAVGRPLDQVLRIINEASREPVANPVARVLGTGQVAALANRTVLIARDGTETAIEDSAAPIQGDGGAIAGVVLVFRDVAAKHRSERLLAEQKEALELIAQGKALPEILGLFCRMIEGQTQDAAFASILLAEGGGAHWRLGAGPSLPTGYHAVVEAVAIAHGIASAGPTSRLGEAVYVADVQADPLWRRFAAYAVEHHLRDCWSRPIMASGGEILGIFTLSRRRAQPPSAEELKGIDIVTRTAAIAIERERSRVELGDARSRLDSALSAGSIGTWSWDLTRDWLVADAFLVDLFGIAPSDAAGSAVAPYLKAIHPEDLARVEQALGDAIATGGRYRAEFRLVAADGLARLVEGRGRVEVAPDGRPLRMAGVVLDISDRKRVEHEKDQLTLLVENSGEFIAITSVAGLPTYTNAMARRMMGVADRDAVGLSPLRDYFFAEDRPFLGDEFFPRVLAEGYARAEVRLRHLPTGTASWLDIGATLLRGIDGAPIGIALIGRDLAERRAADEERRAFAARIEAQARLLDSALSNLPDHAYVFDLNGRFSYANRPLLDLWQLTLEEVTARDLPELGYTPELADRLRGQLRQVIENRAQVSDETPFAGAGASGYFEYILAPVLAPDGRVEAIVGSSRDITERKRAEEANRLRAAQLQKLAGLATRINAAHDVNSVIRVVSREALNLFGAERASISMVLNPDFPQPVNVVSHATENEDRVEALPPDLDEAALAEALNQTSRPIRLTRAELDAAPGLARLSRMAGDSSVQYGWLAAPFVSRDQKAMGLIQLVDKQGGAFTEDDEALLVQLSLLAAVAIENARLYDELRGNDRRKDEFLAMLAHELRNPLAAISNATKLLSRASFDEHGEWSLEIITRQMHHLTRLIEDLLDVSRISRGKIELRRDLIDATPVLDSASATVRALVEERKHTLEVAIDRGNLWVSADPTRLEQVVVNLLNNAAKYSENAGHIRLEAWNEGDQVVIRVTDRGVGIPPEKLPQMFELFAQGDRSLARSEGGLGIGLTVVKKLVELHGGTIQARSEGTGHGSEFTIRLPAAARPGRSTPPDSSHPAPLAPPVAVLAPAEPRKARILVVDDNVDTARGMTRLLKLIGHTTATAHSGPEAIEVARRHRPEVVLLDIGLPGMSGYEVAAALRREESCRDALIIAVSGYGQDEDRRRSREAGFDHHLIKPLDHDALLELLAGP